MPDIRSLELGAGRNPMPGMTAHHDRIAHSPHIAFAHDLDALPWPWADGEWDLVVARDVMEHLRLDVADWLDECWRILAPGGRLLLRLPSPANPLSYRDPTHRRINWHPETFHFWDRTQHQWREWGSIYFAERNRWWRVARVGEEHGDLTYELVKEG